MLYWRGGETDVFGTKRLKWMSRVNTVGQIKVFTMS